MSAANATNVVGPAATSNRIKPGGSGAEDHCLPSGDVAQTLPPEKLGPGKATKRSRPKIIRWKGDPWKPKVLRFPGQPVGGDQAPISGGRHETAIPERHRKNGDPEPRNLRPLDAVAGPEQASPLVVASHTPLPYARLVNRSRSQSHFAMSGTSRLCGRPAF